MQRTVQTVLTIGEVLIFVAAGVALILAARVLL